MFRWVKIYAQRLDTNLRYPDAVAEVVFGLIISGIGVLILTGRFVFYPAPWPDFLVPVYALIDATIPYVLAGWCFLTGYHFLRNGLTDEQEDTDGR